MQPTVNSDEYKPVVKKSVTYIVAAVLFNERGEVLMMQVRNYGGTRDGANIAQCNTIPFSYSDRSGKLSIFSRDVILWTEKLSL